jgi:hypothetical protein
MSNRIHFMENKEAEKTENIIGMQQDFHSK